jgi:hypothetical protein
MRQLRLSEEQAGAVTEWAARQPDKPNWSEAVRRLRSACLARKAVVTLSAGGDRMDTDTLLNIGALLADRKTIIGATRG